MNSTIQNMFFDGIYTTTVNRTLTQNYFLKNIPFLRSFYGPNFHKRTQSVSFEAL